MYDDPTPPAPIRFTSASFRDVLACSSREAAKTFAERQARREYGRKGYCRVARLDSWTESGRSATYECFIGYTVDRQGTTSGHNVWITVYAAEGR